MAIENDICGFDFHCHVDLHSNPTDIIRECENRRIAVFAVTTTPKAWRQNLEWTKPSKLVHAAVGLHPELVGERFAEIDLLERIIAEQRLIGEVGLDGSPQYKSIYSRQKEVFSRVLTAAQQHAGRVISIHSRRAARDVINAVENYTNPSDVLCILHWFTGSMSELRRAIDLGCYFSVNPAMLRHEQGVKLVRSIPIDRMLVETDSPFTEVNSRKSVPWDVIAICSQMAYLLGQSEDGLKGKVTHNANAVFQFAGIDI